MRLTSRVAEARTPDLILPLPFDLRSRSRFRVRSIDGEEIGVQLDRGQVLRGGDLLLATDGRIVQVDAALETVSTLRSADARCLMRAAYHLGNRHVALQIGEGWVRYGHDHVLDAMARGLGAEVIVEEQPFEPEAGAYHTGGAAHGDAHRHVHDP